MIKLKKNILIIFWLTMFFCFNHSVFAATYRVNIAVIGNVRAGKSALIQRIVSGTFFEDYKMTNWENSAEIFAMENTVGDDTFQYLFWDAPGFQKGADEVKVKVTRMAISGENKANIVMIVTDLTSSDVQDERFTSPIAEVTQTVVYVMQANPDCKIIIVGSHADAVTQDVNEAFVTGINSNLTKVFKDHSSISCFVISSKEDDDRGLSELKKSLQSSIGSISKDKLQCFTGQMRTCCVCNRPWKIEECATKDGKYYCPEHKREALKKRCPGSRPGHEHWFVPSDGSCVRSCIDMQLYCSQACMEMSTSKRCALDGCDNIIPGEHCSKHKGKQGVYCTYEHLVAAEGIVCPICKNVKFLPGKGKKIGEQECCSQCAEKTRIFCDAPGCMKEIVGNPYESDPPSGKKYCSREHLRQCEGLRCLQCNRRFLVDDRNLVDTDDPSQTKRIPVIIDGNSYCCEYCALQHGEGVYCAARKKCVKDKGKIPHLKTNMVRGEKGAYYCSRECLYKVEDCIIM